MSIRAEKLLRWQRSQSLLSRQWQITTAILGLVGRWLGDWAWHRNSARLRQKRARQLVQTLLNLGPTFIKIGQFLSTRIDLLPWEYVEALRDLQDRVPPFSSRQALEIVSRELGYPLPELYAEFTAEPLAAASLGQVHRATLHTGEAVVVKVQRPYLQQLLSLDYRVIGAWVKLIHRMIPVSRRYDLPAIYEEFFSILLQEIDYIREGQNADRFRQNFQAEPHIRVPKIYWTYTTSRVLTMEYLPGIRIDNRAALAAHGLNPQALNQLGICCYLKQLLIDGFFHADPHPGNLAVTTTGDLIFYDYGMMTEVAALNQEQMVATFFAVLQKDTQQVIVTLTQLGLIEPVADMSTVERIMQVILTEFTERPLDVEFFSQMRQDVYLLFQQQPFRLPAKLTYILKSLTTLDGIARTLDANYNLVAAAQPFVKQLALSSRGRGWRALTQQTQSFIQRKLNQPSHTEILLQNFQARLERGDIKVRVKAPETEIMLRRVYLTLQCLLLTSVAGFTLLGGILLLLGDYWGGAIFLFMVTALAVLGLGRLAWRLLF
ncbi:ABC1 kinase family protein [Pseudocalidococcus azoricus]|nr:AarF/ABC1/UbiB kinase family protein [Pseudocalidococcus azoricus]